MLFIVIGVILEVSFAILTITVYYTLQSPTGILMKLMLLGILSILFVDGVVELLSITMVMKLFQDIKSKEIENLIWIKKLGNKTKNMNVKFKLPKRQIENDEQMKKFETRIN